MLRLTIKTLMDRCLIFKGMRHLCIYVFFIFHVQIHITQIKHKILLVTERSHTHRHTYTHTPMVILQSNDCNTLLLLLQRQWAIPEKIQTVTIEDIKFLGVLKSMWKFQGSIEKEVGISGVFKQSSYGISMGLCFSPWNFQG